MAKVSAIVKNNKRKVLVEKYRKKRLELVLEMRDVNLDPKSRFEAMKKLTKLPRNSMKIRVKNRCAFTGRPKGYIGFFDLCRNRFRELASKGLIPGIVKI